MSKIPVYDIMFATNDKFYLETLPLIVGICLLPMAILFNKICMFFFDRARNKRIAELYKYYYDNSRKPGDIYYGQGPMLPPDDYSHI